MASFLADWRMEVSRNKIMGVSGVESKMRRPTMPHVPVTLPEHVVTGMITKSVKDLMLDADEPPNGSPGGRQRGRRATKGKKFFR
jgi:hypothetical protein